MINQLNPRCPFQLECERNDCQFIHNERQCVYYRTNAMPGAEIEDQAEKLFSYEGEPSEGGQLAGVRDIDTITGEIQEAQRIGGEAIITIGQRLIEAKAMLKHGEWLPWLAEKVGYSERTAQGFMQLARTYSNPQLVADLGMRKALQLLALPESDREEFLSETHQVNGKEKTVIDMTSRELEKAIKERDEARKAAEQAQADTRAAQESRRSMEESLKEANSLMDLARMERMEAHERAAELEKQLAELQAAPVEVAVMEVDQAQLDAARAEGEAAKAEEVARLQAQLEKAAAMSDPNVAKFQVCFDQVQELINKMRGFLLKARGQEDRTNAERMAKAILALGDVVKEAAQ